MSKISVLASLTSSIKGDHVYSSGASIGDKFDCLLEPENVHSASRNAIKIVRTDGIIIGHVPEPVAQRLAPLIRSGVVSHVTAEVTGASLAAHEGTWTQGGGIEIPSKYKLRGQNTEEINVRQTFVKK